MLNLSYQIGRILYPQLHWRMRPQKGTVHLTFDDGPHPVVTPWVLDQLAESGHKATFFMVGQNAQKHPQIVERIKQEGHEVGNHTQHHIKGWSHEVESYVRDVEECWIHLPETDLFRPPYGRISRKSIPALSNYRVIMWDVLSRDYRPKLNWRSASRRIRNQTVEGSIIVFHDSAKAEANLRKMLPAYLQFLSTKGWSSKVIAFNA